MGDELIGALPPVTSDLVDCPQAYLYPTAGDWDVSMVPPGTAALPEPGAGYGWVGGVVDNNGVENWITNIEGWDQGANMDIQSEDPGLSTGTHVTSVLGRGRVVTVEGTLFDPSGGVHMEAASRMLAGALGTAPHLGWLKIDGLWLPVALESMIKQSRKDPYRVDYEFTLRGRDGVSPGHGVYREKRPGQSVATVDSVLTPVTNDGLVAALPYITWKPAATTDQLSVYLDGYATSTVMKVGSSGIGKGYDPDIWLEIDTMHHQLDVMTTVDLKVQSVGSGRYLVDWPASTWLSVPPGGCDLTAIHTNPGSECTVAWVELF